MASFSGDYYRRLRLSKNASRQDIKAAFRRLSRRYHPDLHPNQPRAASAFHSLREAYEVLIDRIQRQQYDRICHSVGQNEAVAEATLSQASQQLLNPRTPADFYLRGIRYALVHNHKAALKEYDQALSLNSKLEIAYLRRAEARYALGDDPGVLADCQRAIALDPGDSQTHYYLGLARFRLGYVQSAIAAFTSAIACDPEDAQSYARRGLAYEDINDVIEAARDLRRAAQLYKQQGDLAKHKRLKKYLCRFGTIGRSHPVKIYQSVAQRVLKLWIGIWSALSRGLGLSQSAAKRDWLATEASKQSAHIRQRSLDQLSLKPDNRSEIFPMRPIIPERRANKSESQRPESKQRWPLVERRSQQVYWVPNFSTESNEFEPHFTRDRPIDSFIKRFLGGVRNTLRLLTNPAGELVPVYRQLSYYQANRVGYGLAVLANLFLMTGLMSLLSQTSWLEASRLWAAGAVGYAAMILTVATARLCLRLRGLWAADIFTVGAAVVPIGISTCLLAGIQAASKAIAQMPTISVPLTLWLINLFTLLILLWAISHALISLYSGLCTLHPFPAKFAGWFVPTIIAIGFAAGLGTWQWLSTPTQNLMF